MDIKQVRDGKLLIDKVEQALQAAYQSNGDFNESLDVDGHISLRGLKDPDHIYRYAPSEVLYWADRNAYLDEYDQWYGKRLAEEHADSIGYLRDTGQVATFQDIVTAVRLHRVAPFVGAGLSLACDFPTWGGALQKLMIRLEAVQPHVQPLLEAKEFLKAAQLLFDASPAQVTHFIRTEFRRRPRAVAGPVLLLPELSQGCVVTTNFDTLIEDVFRDEFKQPLEGYMYGMQQGNNFVVRLLRGERCILKLHGDAGQDNSYVFTEQQYLDAYGEPVDFRKPLPRALRQIFISHSLLFLGCSLEQDKTLELFKSIVDEASFEIPDHFAILPRPDTAELRRDKENRLLGMKIQPLWYEPVGNDHSMLEKLLRLLIAGSKQQITIG
jgi:hypothetical protein